MRLLSSSTLAGETGKCSFKFTELVDDEIEIERDIVGDQIQTAVRGLAVYFHGFVQHSQPVFELSVRERPNLDAFMIGNFIFIQSPAQVFAFPLITF